MNNSKSQIKFREYVPWICFGFIALIAIVIFICSVTLGNDPKYPKAAGVFNFVNMTKSMEGLDEYADDIIKIIDGAKKNINMISHCFYFKSNYSHLFDENPPEIIDTSPPDSYIHKEGEILQALKRALDERHVKVRIITQNSFTNTSISFFRYNGVSYRTYDTETGALLLNEIITADSKTILISSSLFDNEIFNKSRVVSVRFQDGPYLADDLDRYFTLTWKQLDETEQKELPPYSRFWQYNLKAKTTIANPYIFENKATAYFVQQKSTYMPPLRDNSVDAVQNLLNSAKKRIVLSASFFELEHILFMYNLLAQSSKKKYNIKILLSDIPRLYRNTSSVEELNQTKINMLKQAATVAPLNNIFVHVSEENTGVPDFIVVDNNLFFSSGPISAILYGGSLGVALVVNDKNLTDNFVQVFDEDWNVSRPFKDYLNYIYPNN